MLNYEKSVRKVFLHMLWCENPTDEDSRHIWYKICIDTIAIRYSVQTLYYSSRTLFDLCWFGFDLCQTRVDLRWYSCIRTDLIFHPTPWNIIKIMFLIIFQEYFEKKYTCSRVLNILQGLKLRDFQYVPTSFGLHVIFNSIS